MSKTTKQHYIQRSLLKYFSNDTSSDNQKLKLAKKSDKTNILLIDTNVYDVANKKIYTKQNV